MRIACSFLAVVLGCGSPQQEAPAAQPAPAEDHGDETLPTPERTSLSEREIDPERETEAEGPTVMTLDDATIDPGQEAAAGGALEHGRLQPGGECHGAWTDCIADTCAAQLEDAAACSRHCAAPPCESCKEDNRAIYTCLNQECPELVACMGDRPILPRFVDAEADPGPPRDAGP